MGNVECVACAQSNDLDQKCDCKDGFIAAEGDCLTFFLKHYNLRENNDINEPDQTGRTMLNVAAQVGNYRIVQFLVLHGADVNFRETKAGNTPLHEAAFHEHASVVSFLMGAGARTDIRNKFGRTPVDATRSPLIRHLILHPQRRSSVRFSIPQFDRKPRADLIETEHLLHSDSEDHSHYDEDDSNAEEDVDDRKQRSPSASSDEEIFSLEMIEEVYKKLRMSPADEFLWLLAGIRYSVYRYQSRPVLAQKMADTIARLYTLDLNLQRRLNTDLCTGNILSPLLPFAQALRAAALTQRGYRDVCYRCAALSREDIKEYQSLPDGCWSGFSSCTKKRELCADMPGNVIFEIHPHIYADEETSVARDISGLSPFPDEHEVLILNGACFRVTSVTKPSFGGLKGKWTIQVKLTPRRVLLAIGRLRAERS